MVQVTEDKSKRFRGNVKKKKKGFKMIHTF
jgi:hypothetical protein